MASAIVSSSRVLAPVASLAGNKPSNSTPSVLHTPSVFTNKEWIIPPRPKPGRKPAADTPPTKRKAQNRAAQRAFRERRAAKVGELEDCMKKMEEEDEREQEELRGQIQHLEEDVQKYHNMLLSWQQRCEGLERHLAEEQRLRKNARSELLLLQMRQNASTDAVPLPPKRYTNHTHCAPVKPEVNEPTVFAFENEIAMGCGKCSRDSRCECIEQAFALDSLAPDPTSKRPHSPSLSQDTTKRVRQSPPADFSSTEIDFTTQFVRSHPPTTLSSSMPTTTATPLDPCGFCSNGTPCICAEMAAEPTPSLPIDYNYQSTTSNPSTAIQNPCINGPGTCAQCQVSSTSTLFCKALAATREPEPSYLSPFPLKAKPQSTIPPAQTTAITGPTFSCADTFTCLSRHPAFDRASDDLGSWMPRLATVPASKGESGKEGGEVRTAFEVEAASVLEVLRFFDRRFGQEG